MPNPIQCRLFRTVGKQGFVSTYFLSSPDLVTALGDAQKLNTAEMALLGQSCQCPRISVSQLGVKRDVNAGPAITATGQFAGNPQGAADPNICLTVMMTATDLVRSPKYLRGLPVAVCEVGADRLALTTTAAFVTAYTAWQTAMNGLVVLVPGKRTGAGPFTSFPFKFIPTIEANQVLELRIRRAGRPFDLQPGRRRVGA